MNLSIFDTGVQADQTALLIDEASLYRAFEQVKDGRKKKGKRYPLALLLTLILLGKLAGEQSINGIVDSCQGTKALAPTGVELAETLSGECDLQLCLSQL